MCFVCSVWVLMFVGLCPVPIPRFPSHHCCTRPSCSPSTSHLPSRAFPSAISSGAFPRVSDVSSTSFGVLGERHKTDFYNEVYSKQLVNIWKGKSEIKTIFLGKYVINDTVYCVFVLAAQFVNLCKLILCLVRGQIF